MGGDGYRLQIDESLFRGRRKYNRVKYLSDDYQIIESPLDNILALRTNNKK